MSNKFIVNPFTGKFDATKILEEAMSLTDLDDVTITDVQDDDFLKYNSGTSEWENFDLLGADNIFTGSNSFTGAVTTFEQDIDFDTDEIRVNSGAMLFGEDVECQFNDSGIIRHDGTWHFEGNAEVIWSTPIAWTLSCSSIFFGTNSTTDTSMNFRGGTNDGQFKWIEDEDYFLFMDDVVLNNEGLYFDTNLTESITADHGDLNFGANGVFNFVPSDSGDTTLGFKGSTNNGVLTWMEGEDYFKFSDDVLMDTAEKIYFRDTDIFIHSNADGEMTLQADTLVTIGVAGDITLGDATERAIKPATDLKINLGVEDDYEFNDLWLGGDARISGDLEVVGTITGVSQRKKLLPSDFVAVHNYANLRPADATGDYAYCAYSPYDAVAYVQIPTGFKATAVMVYGNDTSNTVNVYEGEINDGTTATSKGSGVVGTEIDIIDVTATTTNYLVIAWAGAASSDYVYGGYVDFEVA